VSRNDVILGVAALVLVAFSLVVSLLIPRRDPGFPGRSLGAFFVVAIALVVAVLASVEIFGESHAGEGEEAEHAETGATDTGATDTGATDDGGGEGDAAAGEQVYASAGCGDCHTLEEAGSTGTVGPSLDDSTADLQATIDQVTNGGGGMPPFSGTLSEQEIADVAAFVVASQG
jgi:mono/diheme cytochrome c family protein